MNPNGSIYSLYKLYKYGQVWPGETHEFNIIVNYFGRNVWPGETYEFNIIVNYFGRTVWPGETHEFNIIVNYVLLLHSHTLNIHSSRSRNRPSCSFIQQSYFHLFSKIQWPFLCQCTLLRVFLWFHVCLYVHSTNSLLYNEKSKVSSTFELSFLSLLLPPSPSVGLLSFLSFLSFLSEVDSFWDLSFLSDRSSRMEYSL